MAIIKYISPADRIQGVKNGVVFSQGRGGYIAQARVCPTRSRTNRRTPRQSAVSQIRGRWRYTLNGPQRTAWNDLGAATFWTNALGDAYSPNGFNLYIRTNTLRLVAGLALIDVAPANAVCTAYNKIFLWDETGKQLYAVGSGSTPSAYRCFFQVSPVLPPTVSYYSSPFVFTADASGGTVKSGFPLRPAAFFALGNHIAIRWRDMAADGSLSAPQVDVVELEKTVMFTLGCQRNDVTYTDPAEYQWFYTGSVLLYPDVHATFGHFPLPIACRLRHVGIHIRCAARVGVTGEYYIRICHNAGTYAYLPIPGSNVANTSFDYNFKNLTGYNYAVDDWFTLGSFVSCTPGSSLNVKAAIATCFFEVGDFT